MKYNKLLLALLAWVIAAGQVWASEPFRRHREDAFSALAPKEGSIVFIGNSITHMNEWRESFGVPADVSILNRGISGAISDEVVKNLESYIANKPQKVFLMIGTNDLGTSGMNYPEYPLSNLKKIIERIRKESPNTEIYVQSILPSSVGLRASNVPQTNPLYQAYVEGLQDEKVKWVNLYDQLKEGNTNHMKSGTSLDDLHPNAAGYGIWTRYIKDYVGYTPVYPETLTSINTNDATYGGCTAAWGMRISNFYRFPVKADNIMLLGDEVFHGSEFHELLGNANVLGHGIGWGYGAATLTQMIAMAKASLGESSCLKEDLKRESPKQIYLYAGTSDMTGTTTVDNAITQYEELIKVCQEKAPTSQLFVLTVLNTVTNSSELTKIKSFNEKLAELVKKYEGVTLIDTYKELNSSGDTRNDEYFCDPEGGRYYVSGLGYARLAEVLAEHIGEGCTPVTVEQARKTQQLNEARNALGIVVSQALDVRYDGTAGSYAESARTLLEPALESAYAELAKGADATTESLQACQTALENAMAGLAEHIVLPRTSTEGDVALYKLQSVRGAKVMTNNGARKSVTGAADMKNARQAWKFVQRTDNTLDIVNSADGSYLNPDADNDSPLKTSKQQPAKGWTLKGADRIGTFIITSDAVQVNQSVADNVLNWGDGTNTADVGCQYYISPAELPEASWYRIRYEKNAALNGYYTANSLTGRYVLNKETEYKQTTNSAVFYYPLGVSTEAVTPEQDDAIYYVNIQEASQPTMRYIQSANGHYTATNATATLEPTLIPFTEVGDYVNIGNSFISFTNLDHTWGYTSNATHASATGYSVEAVDLEAAGLSAWRVNIMNGTTSASNISANTQVTCSNSAAKGLKRVYDQGTFFFPTSVTPEASDFTVEGSPVTVSVSADARTITVQVGAAEVSTEEAEALLAHEGVGYPPSDAATRRTLAKAIENGDAEELAEAMEDFKADPNVVMPESGKAYYLVNYQSDGTMFYLYQTTEGLQLASTTTAEGLPESALFVARKQQDGLYVFANTFGQYLVFKGQNAGANGNKGYLDAYDEAQCQLTVKRFVAADGNNISLKSGVTDADLFGYFSIRGKRADGTSDVYFVTGHDGTFSQATVPFYNDSYASSMRLIEAADWHNAVDWVATGKSGRWGTMHLPFSVDKGDVMAYAVTVDENSSALTKTEIDGTVIPARTPVLLLSESEDEVRLVPAITTGTAVSENELTAEPTGTVFALGTHEGRPAFVPSQESAEAGKAYLSFTTAPVFTALFVDDVVNSIGQVEVTTEGEAPAAYDLSGRRVKDMKRKGVYIVGKRKVLVK